MPQVVRKNHLRPGYHDLIRPEILNLIPKGAKRILDLGCGTGELGKAIKQRQKCEVIGVELNRKAAAIALQNLDHAVTADVEAWKPPAKIKRFDCLIFADILEHLFNPWQVLKRYRDLLTPDGVVVASLPNIAHPAVVNQLQKGLFLYQPAGILDFTHLRYFTKTTIFQLFTKAGLKVRTITPFPSAADPRQYLVTASTIPTLHPHPRVTILVLSYNGLGYTKQCLHFIRENTHVPYKLIVVDNGSTDGSQPGLLLENDLFTIFANQNLGFAAGFNLGIECVDTPFFALLNNDIVVSEGWLSRLMMTISSDKNYGIVGPISNNISGPQLDQNAKYNNLEEMARYAQQVKEQNDGKVTAFPRIVFFCTLFRSELIKKVGLLDPRFGIGNFDDDDYCRRATLAGYKLVIDHSVFIHHYGSVTFRLHGFDYNKIMERNLALFKQKWGLP